MGTAFDPYHRWLGIPPAEQPAHHYRLLGLRAFEDDLDVIQNAADQRMAHLRTFQSGAHAKACAQLLNDVSAAKVTLLNPENKAQYDRQLHAQLAPPTVQPVAIPVTAATKPPPLHPQPRQPDAALEGLPGQVGPSSASIDAKVRTARRRRSQSVSMVATTAVVLALIAGAVALVVNRSGDPADAAKTALAFDWSDGDRQGATLQIDGRKVEFPESGSWEFACDPGSHEIEVTRSGYQTVRQTVHVDQGQSKDIAIVWNKQVATDAGKQSTDPTPQALAQKQPVALLARVDATADRVSGDWSRHDTQLVGKSARDACLPLPVHIEGTHYVVGATFALHDKATAVLCLPAGLRRLNVLVSEAQVQLSKVDGQIIAKSLATEFLPGTPHRIDVEVARGAADCEIRVSVDGANPLLTWKGKESLLTGWRLSDRRRPALGVRGGEVTFHAAYIKMLGGEAAWIEGRTAPPAGTTEPSVPSAAPPANTAGGLLAEIFEGEDFDRLVARRIDDRINWSDDTGGLGPGLPKERFTVRYTGWLRTPKTGTYTLRVAWDDGLRIWLGGRPIVDQWTGKRTAPDHFMDVMIESTGGYQPLKIEYRQFTGSAYLSLRWLPPGRTADEVIPADAFLHDKLPPDEPLGIVGTGPPEDPPPERLAVPTTEQQQKTRTELEEIYKIGEADTPDRRRQLADELARLSEESHDQPVERFVLLDTAVRLAGAGGDARTMLNAAGKLAESYEVDALKYEADAVVALAKAAADAAAVEALYTASEDLVDRALEANRHDVAAGVAEAVNLACQQSSGAAFRKAAYDRHQRIAKIHQTWQQAQQALAKLKTDAADPEANLAAGRWYCLDAGDWPTGLPHLSKGSDPKLKALAAADLAADAVTDAPGRVGIADAWWDAAADSSGRDKQLMLLRARHWYEQARSAGPSSLLAIKVGKRLEEIAPLLDDRGGPTSRPRDTNPFEPNKFVDLIPYVDTAGDAVAGNWQRAGDSLTVATGNYGQLALPVTLQGSYDLEVEFVRTEGDDAIAIIFPVGHTQIALVLSAARGSAHGMEHLDNRSADDRRNPSRRRPGILQNDRRYTALVGVRVKGEKALIDVVFNGKKFMRTFGTLDGLSLPSRWDIQNAARPGLGAKESEVKFTKARIRLVDGKATLVAR